MNRNRFDKIRQIFHINEYSKHLPVDHPQHDRLHKVRPVIDYLNKKFITVPFEHRLSLDEQMCSTKNILWNNTYPTSPISGDSNYTFYALCLGMPSFEIYSGAKDIDRLPVEPVLGAVPRHVSHITYFDNFYTNISLLHYLTNEGIYCLGTVQRNGLGKSQLTYPEEHITKMWPLTKAKNFRPQVGKTTNKYNYFPRMLALNQRIL